jgi:hypothetical protein
VPFFAEKGVFMGLKGTGQRRTKEVRRTFRTESAIDVKVWGFCWWVIVKKGRPSRETDKEKLTA